MIKWCNLLDGDFHTRLSVDGGNDHPVGAFSNHIDNLVCGSYWVSHDSDNARDGEAGLMETENQDSPTLNFTFLGAEALDPFVVFSCGAPWVLV